MRHLFGEEMLLLRHSPIVISENISYRLGISAFLRQANGHWESRSPPEHYLAYKNENLEYNGQSTYLKINI